MNAKAIIILESLTRVCREGAEGFKLASLNVKSTVLQSLFRGYSRQRARFADELEAAAAALGRKSSSKNGGGERKGAGREQRTASAGTEAETVAECEGSEDAALAAFRAALDAAALPPAIHALVSLQAAAVRNARSEIQRLRTRPAP